MASCATLAFKSVTFVVTSGIDLLTLSISLCVTLNPPAVHADAVSFFVAVLGRLVCCFAYAKAILSLVFLASNLEMLFPAAKKKPQKT